MTSHPIPTTLDEAVDAVIAQMGADDKLYWLSHTADECIGPIHHGGAMAMRNQWHLWEQDTPLARDLTAKGAIHGDDRSTLILNGVWHKLNGLTHDIAAEAESNRAHWARQGVRPDGTPLT